jgi:hypothetical protein
VLHRLGATPSTPVTILSDGADGPRSLGEAACIGPTSHVLDWFHLAMRIQHVAQAAEGWPTDTPGEREDGARLTDAVEHIRWRLWHGQVQRALDLAGETLAWLEAMADATTAAAAKVTALLRGLETYVSGQADLIIDYATARRIDEPISTATTETTVQWLLHRRMGANQQMRWTPKGAHCMLKVRTAIADDALPMTMPPPSGGLAGRSAQQHKAPQVLDGLVYRNTGGASSSGRSGSGTSIRTVLGSTPVPLSTQ